MLLFAPGDRLLVLAVSARGEFGKPCRKRDFQPLDVVRGKGPDGHIGLLLDQTPPGRCKTEGEAHQNVTAYPRTLAKVA